MPHTPVLEAATVADRDRMRHSPQSARLQGPDSGVVPIGKCSWLQASRRKISASDAGEDARFVGGRRACADRLQYTTCMPSLLVCHLLQAAPFTSPSPPCDDFLLTCCLALMRPRRLARDAMLGCLLHNEFPNFPPKSRLIRPHRTTCATNRPECPSGNYQ